MYIAADRSEPCLDVKLIWLPRFKEFLPMASSEHAMLAAGSSLLSGRRHSATARISCVRSDRGIGTGGAHP